MAIPFAAPDWLVQEYFNRKSPGQQASDAVQTGLAGYAQAKQAEADRVLQAQDRQLKLAQALAENGQDFGRNFTALGGKLPPGMTPPPVASTPTVAPMASTPNEIAAQQDLPAEHPANIFPNFADVAHLPPHEQSVALGSPEWFAQNRTLHGNKGVDRMLKEGMAPLDIAGKQAIIDERQHKNDPQAVITQGDALAAGKVAPGTRIIAPSTAGDNKATDRQDKLERDAIGRLASIRGDPSIATIETQRNAAIQAYNRISEIEKTGQGANPVDYVDILGQVYKARTGSAPSEVVLQDARQATAKGKFGQAYTYFTGNQAPATTPQIMASLKDMVAHMGTQADLLHEAHMKPHLIKPQGLDQGTWDNIVQNNRGMSFKEATGYNSAPSQPEGLPQVGAMFNGGKVLSVKRVK